MKVEKRERSNLSLNMCGEGSDAEERREKYCWDGHDLLQNLVLQMNEKLMALFGY